MRIDRMDSFGMIGFVVFAFSRIVFLFQFLLQRVNTKLLYL